MGLDQLEFRRVDTWDDCQDFMRWLGNKRDWLGFDVETSGLIPYHDPIRFAQFGDHTMGWGLDYPEWKGLVSNIFDTYRGNIVAHNALFDLKMMKADGVATPQRYFHDTMVMCFLKDPGSRLDLKGASAIYKVYEWQRVASIPASIVGPWKNGVLVRWYDSKLNIIWRTP